ncbi:hypothetical protein PENTCL1PPCAC_27373, partial [Pristionchus entomophagus]
GGGGGGGSERRRNSLFVLADEFLVQIHDLALDTKANHLSILIEEVGNALSDRTLARSSISIILSGDRVLVIVSGEIGVPLPLTLLVASDHLLSLNQSVPLDVPLVQIEDTHEDKVRDRADRENDLAFGEGMIVIVYDGYCREANGDEGDDQTAIHQRVDLLPSRDVVENSANFVVQCVLHRLAVPLVNLWRSIIFVS